MKKDLLTLHAELESLYQENQRDQIDRFFETEPLEWVPQCCSIENEYIFLMNEAGTYYRSISQFEKAISFFVCLARDLSRFQMDKTAAYATVLNNLAGTYRMAGNYQMAEQLFQKSIALYQLLAMEDSYPYASALNNLSLCYTAMGQQEKALTYQYRAIQCLSGQEHKDFPAIAASYVNLSNIYHALGQDSEALDAVKQSLELFQACDQVGSPAYIGGLHIRGVLRHLQGNYIEALSDFQNAMTQTEKLFGKNADYAVIMSNAAQTLQSLGRSDEAAACMAEAAALNLQLFGESSRQYLAAMDQLKGMAVT